MLIAFRIHGVSQQFIREIRAEGLTAIDSDKLIAYRIHGVTPELVREGREQVSRGHAHQEPGAQMRRRLRAQST